MNECPYCLHPILSEDDFGAIRNHTYNCPGRSSPYRSDIEAYQKGYIHRLRGQKSEKEMPAYELGWDQADRYLIRQKLKKKYRQH